MIIQENTKVNDTTANTAPQAGNIIKICYASSKNYVKYLALSMATVLTSKAPEDKLSFYILDGGLTEKDKTNILDLRKISDFEIEFIEPDKTKFKNCPINTAKYLSIAIYYRLSLPDILQDTERILYIDCDTRITGSLKELFNTDLEGKPLGAAHDVNSRQLCKEYGLNDYYNSGVLLLDLNKLREIKFTSEIFDWISQNSEKLKYNDQDAINLYLANRIKTLNSKYNVQIRNHARNYKTRFGRAVISHYIAQNKGRFIYNALPTVFKTKYANQLLAIYIKYLLKSTIQWIFMYRKKNKTTKDIQILGYRFYLKHKPKHKDAKA